MKSTAVKEKEVALEELTQEAFAMVKVCFEGEVERCEDGIKLRLPSGETFLLSLKKVG